MMDFVKIMLTLIGMMIAFTIFVATIAFAWRWAVTIFEYIN